MIYSKCSFHKVWVVEVIKAIAMGMEAKVSSSNLDDE